MVLEIKRKSTQAFHFFAQKEMFFAAAASLLVVLYSFCTYLGSDLVSALTGLNVYNFPHVDVFGFYLIIIKMQICQTFYAQPQRRTVKHFLK